MNNTEVVIKVLDNHGCQNTKEISRDAMRLFNVSITPHEVSGVLRKLVSSGEASKSNCGNGSTVYWLNRKGSYYWNN